MLSQCQQSIDDKDNVWAFMLRQIVDVFVIMAYDKLKARLDDLAVITAAQCEAIVIEFDLLCTSRKICPVYFAISLLVINYLRSFIIMLMFFRERDMTPITDKKTWVKEWIKENHSRCSSYNTQQCKNLYFGL